MKSQWDIAREIGLHDNPETCKNCGTQLVFGSLSDLSKAYTHHNWSCGKCGADAYNLIYGLPKNNTQIAGKQ